MQACKRPTPNTKTHNTHQVQTFELSAKPKQHTKQEVQHNITQQNKQKINNQHKTHQPKKQHKHITSTTETNTIQTNSQNPK